MKDDDPILGLVQLEEEETLPLSQQGRTVRYRDRMRGPAHDHLGNVSPSVGAFLADEVLGPPAEIVMRVVRIVSEQGRDAGS